MHSADVDNRDLIPMLMELDVGYFYMQMASEFDPDRALSTVAKNLKPGKRVFVGVINVIYNTVESPDTVSQRVMEAATHIPQDQLGTTDDYEFSPFGVDVAQARDIAFDKIAAQVAGTALASKILGVSMLVRPSAEGAQTLFKHRPGQALQ